MQRRHIWLALALLAGGINGAYAQNALTGRVSSNEEAMEGVLVSAKKDGASITTTVATDAQGRYSFPAGRIEPGKYAISIRAVGYKLDGPKTVDVPTGTTAPSSTWIAAIVPVRGEGISTLALSVITSTSGCSSLIGSPAFTSQRTISPSATPSPMSGSFTS